MIRFGAMSITLLVGAFYGLLFAALLWFAPRNRLANRCLALLLVVIALRLAPYIAGYAGYYDAYPWLSFAPYNLSLAIGPLLWCYVRLLPRGDAPLDRAMLWHFVPVLLQFVYYCVIFAQPVAFKNAWDDGAHARYVFPVELGGTFVSMAVYGWFAARSFRAYQHWLADNVSDRDEHLAEWLRNFLIALGITLAFWLSIVAYHWLVARLNYFQQFPFYVWLTVLAYYLGTEGYRHARHRYPAWPAVAVAAGERAVVPPASTPPPPAAARDWSALGATYRAQIAADALYRDPELSLAGLARKLGTNTSQLSAAINDGLGINFNELVNRLRVDHVKQALDDASDRRSVLDIALDAGFSSKASFNRSFKQYAGMTPSEYRSRGPATG